MYRYKAMCRFKNEPGSGAGWVYTMADNPFQAMQFLKAQYGGLLISAGAIKA